jgi:hypothetical protein
MTVEVIIITPITKTHIYMHAPPLTVTITKINFHKKTWKATFHKQVYHFIAMLCFFFCYIQESCVVCLCSPETNGIFFPQQLKSTTLVCRPLKTVYQTIKMVSVIDNNTYLSNRPVLLITVHMTLKVKLWQLLLHGFHSQTAAFFQSKYMYIVFTIKYMYTVFIIKVYVHLKLTNYIWLNQT